jgi:hypothetical protein
VIPCSEVPVQIPFFNQEQASEPLLHAQRRPCILLKIDIAKAFDMINRSFLHDFSTTWDSHAVGTIGFRVCFPPLV